MAIFELYSKRTKQNDDIYSYDDLPQKIRIQIRYIISDFLERNRLADSSESFWKFIYEVLAREHGKSALHISLGIYTGRGSYSSQVLNYLEEEKEIDKVLDIVEIAFRCISKYAVFLQGNMFNNFENYPIDEAINDLNYRFRENGVGYKFENGIIIKFDNELLHTTITKPALIYLTNPDYKSINEEFLNAHEHFRHGKLKESINECLKAFESTMKIICFKKGWSYNQSDTSNKLIQILFDKNYIPNYLQTQITSLRSTLESGIPTIRNKTSAHGKGVANIIVNDELASYTINLTGSMIKFLLDIIDK